MNLFNSKDYQSISLGVTAKNITSGIDLSNPKLEKNPKSPLQLIELLEAGGAVFAFPKGSCSVGHRMGITLSIKSWDIEHRMSLTAKVLSVTDDESTGSIIRTQFAQYIREDWEKLLQVYSKRQDEILIFFEAARGDA